MKLQLSPQSLRLRLDAAELLAFDQAGQLDLVLDLGAGPPLTCTLRRLPEEAPAPALQARYAADVLTVEVPAMLARQLVAGTAVGLKGETRGTNGQLLRILVEKDLGPSH